MTLNWKESLKEALKKDFKIIIKHDKDGKDEATP
tara:strand:- start:440 stop:541 length:102 start_codon:yes stop_codon:yes gene_type:complete